MRAVLGLLSILTAATVGYWLYTANLKAVSPKGSPAQTIATVGIQSDLLSIAQAERMYQASHGSYASLDELYASGALSVKKNGRDGYTYSVETSTESFTITARCQPQPSASCPNFSIDQNMQVQQLP